MDAYERLTFRKSSFSNRRSRCVEVAFTTNSVIVRNSKSPFPVVAFTPGEWEAFLDGVKNQEFELPPGR